MENDLFSETLIEQIDPDKDYYEDLVGEGKKFTDNKSLAKGKVESDLFIKRLIAEADEMRNTIKELQFNGEVEKRVKEKVAPESNLHNQPEEIETPDIGNEVKKQLQAYEAEQRKKSNEASVREELLHKYGSKETAQAEVSRRGKELGLSAESMQQMAQENPKLFLAMFPHKEQPTNIPRTGVNTMRSFTPTTGEKTWSYYQKLKATDPSTYFSDKTRIEMHNQAVKQGERFFDTN
jgi:hypothetical protein